ncbi:MobV family relaxase [Ruminococcus sp. NK3A76]|uniref:MobV family relaxase n=1 Tax=Ruminococcus sp. NK3A76 TaxID=877411 RepID=UPI0004922120|nr:MobV family relaxase [Ruminococcus sp. NK3A76]
MALKKKGDKKNISYAIIRNANHKMGAVPLVERHNERRNHNYTNKDIDHSRTHENYAIKKPQETSYEKEFYRIKEAYGLKGNLRLTGEKQSTILCEFIITSDKEFFDRIGKERTKQFFLDTYRFAAHKVGGEEFIVSAVVHMDEKTPHMHLTFIPTVKGKDRKGNPCRRINASEFWKGRDSYSRLQDEFYEWVTNCGYDLERGVKGSSAVHLSVEEYKIKKTEEQLADLQGKVEEVKAVDSISTTNLPFNMVSVKRADFETLASAAKGYVTAKALEEKNKELSEENRRLCNENESLKQENKVLSAKYIELDIQFSEYYDSVSEQVDLQAENTKLNKEIDLMKLSLEEKVELINKLNKERMLLKDEQSRLNKVITGLTDELSSLKNRFDRVMDFIHKQGLKEKLDNFLHPKRKR